MDNIRTIDWCVSCVCVFVDDQCRGWLLLMFNAVERVTVKGMIVRSL